MHALTASLSSGGISSIPLTFLSTQTQVSSDWRNVSLSMCDTRLSRGGNGMVNNKCMYYTIRERLESSAWYVFITTCTCTCTCIPFDESISDMIVSSDVWREESFGTVEDVHQDGQLCLLQVTPLIVDMGHHILYIKKITDVRGCMSCQGSAQDGPSGGCI